LVLSRSELLRQRTQHDLVNTHIGRLLDGEGDGAGDRVGGDGLFVKLVHRLAAGFVTGAELEFAIHGARVDGGDADLSGLS
jgi:hypothetical protein